MNLLNLLFLNKSKKKKREIYSPRRRMASDPFLGEIAIFPFGYAPISWRLCDGSLLTITSNAALYSLLGTRFGGNGTTNFNIPDLRGKVPLGYDSTYLIGSTGGVNTVALTSNQMPFHIHNVAVNSNAGSSISPVNNFIAIDNEGMSNYLSTQDSNAGVLTSVGSGSAHENMMPYSSLAFYICTNGYYPPRP